MRREDPEATRVLSRISMSLPEELLVELDNLVASRGFPSRSHAISLMLSQHIVEHKGRSGDEVMVGTITLFYYNNVFDLQRQLADLQYRHIREVISSLHVQLIRNQTLEVILVQGPARKIEAIADEMLTLRGVIYGKVQMIASLIPPLHPIAENGEDLDADDSASS